MATPPVANGGPYFYGDQMKTSFHGRRSGLDFNDFAVGGPGGRDGYEIWTQGSTVAGAASPALLSLGGISYIQTTTASTFQMPAPSANTLGVGKTLQFNGSSGVNIEIDAVSGNFQTSLSSTYTKITITPVTGQVNGGLFLQGIQTSSGAFFWSLNGTTGAAGSGSTHIAFA